jgi:hypothetical protein
MESQFTEHNSKPRALATSQEAKVFEYTKPSVSTQLLYKARHCSLGFVYMSFERHETKKSLMHFAIMLLLFPRAEQTRHNILLAEVGAISKHC